MSTQLGYLGRLGLTLLIATLALSGCLDKSDTHASNEAATNDETTSTASFEDANTSRQEKRRSAITIDYTLPETHASIGEALPITVRFGSTTEKGQFEIQYRSDSPQGLILDPSLDDTIYLAANSDGNYPPQTVIVWPQENGRFYLQISAGLRTQTDLMMRPYSVPIQVGPRAQQQPAQKSGTQQATEQGISIPARMD